MSEDQLTKLFKYMSGRFAVIDERFDQQALRFDRIDAMIDQILKKQDMSDDERLVTGY